MSRPSHATIVSYIALFVALGGTSYAAVAITGKQVKNSSLTGSDLKDASVTGRDVKNGSLRAKDFRAGELPAGRQGPQGPQGPVGPTGPTGPRALTKVVIRDGGSGSDQVFCKAGEVALGGGGSVSGFLSRSQPLPLIYQSEPDPPPEDLPSPNGWTIQGSQDPSAPASTHVRPWVICAS
jgi:hypothetical protein